METTQDHLHDSLHRFEYSQELKETAAFRISLSRQEGVSNTVGTVPRRRTGRSGKSATKRR